MAARPTNTQQPSRTRRYHSAEFKRQIVQASMAPNASSAQIAMAHGINPNQLHAWRRQLLRGELAAPTESNAVLVPVEFAAEPQGNAVDVVPVTTRIPEPARQREGFIEVWLGEARVRVHGAVNAESLRCVIESLRT